MGIFFLETFPMAKSTGNPLRDLELRIEKEGEEYKRRRLAEEMQKLADDESAVSPPGGADSSPDSAPEDDTDDPYGRSDH